MSSSAGHPALTIDVVVKVLKQTVFSAFFCAFIPVVIAGHAKSWTQPAVYWSMVWAGFLALSSMMNYIGRIYSASGSYFFLPPRLNWEEQIVLITGGCSGIGALLAQTLALRNVTVVVLDLTLPKDPIENDNIHTYICDVSDYKQVQACAEKVRAEVGHPTIIVNNAGVVKGKLLMDLSEEDIRTTFGANTLAHFWILKAFLPAMLEKGTGHIVNVASLLGIIATAQATDYCASKAALISLHQSLRFELDNRYKTPQIRTTILLPAFLSTPLFARAQMPHHASRLGAFMCPPVSSIDIVKSIISALDEDEGRVIRLPFYTEMARIWGVSVGMAPKWLTDLAQRVSGADWAMRGFGPRPDAGERLESSRKEKIGEKEKIS